VGAATRTRKLAAAGGGEEGGRREQLEALGVEDDSAGYHRRHTVWKVGRSVTYLTAGSRRNLSMDQRLPASERSGSMGAARAGAGDLDGSRIASRPRLHSRPASVHHASIPLIASDWAPFGSFAQRRPPAGIGLGVMESHDVLW
jgi:hypothetical protein